MRKPQRTRLRLAGTLAAVLAATGIAAGPAAQAGEQHGRERTLAELAQRHGRYFGSATDNPEVGLHGQVLVDSGGLPG
ncbi:hypothetical protein [Streptomyces sp. TRM68367]|uniref:hypothetical protein n=1 Tax=Streptomyces sp. TRM68367 TaxID=2758415 RepID=UPI0037DCF0FA